MLVDFVLPGISLALSAVALPGPLTAYLINVTLRAGWRRGLWVVVSPLITDTPIILLALLFLNALQTMVPDAIRWIQIAGGLLLLRIAWGAIQQYRTGATFGAASATAAPDTPRRILGTAILMNFLSPGPYLFWSTVNGPLLLRALDISILHGAAFLLAFYGVFLSGLALLAFVFDRVGSANPRLTRGLMLLTIGLMLFFGLRLIAEGLFTPAA